MSDTYAYPKHTTSGTSHLVISDAGTRDDAQITGRWISMDVQHLAEVTQ